MKANKNDFIDAEAICEAASQPSMRFVSPKTEAQQTLGAYHRTESHLDPAKTPESFDFSMVPMVSKGKRRLNTVWT